MAKLLLIRSHPILWPGVRTQRRSVRRPRADC
ncbi:hypothetical protein CCACVL1_21571, partial [Corchorus capsularis]